MKLSRALTLAAGGLDLPMDRLQTIGRSLAAEQIRAAKRPAESVGARVDDAAKPHDRRERERRRAANAKALQASRSLLVRTIAMLA